jgi:hypothetical protein
MWWSWQRVNWRRRKLWLICETWKCNAINYNVIFIDEILYKEIFILLLLCELVLLCCAYNYQFKYLHDG